MRNLSCMNGLMVATIASVVILAPSGFIVTAPPLWLTVAATTRLPRQRRLVTRKDDSIAGIVSEYIHHRHTAGDDRRSVITREHSRSSPRTSTHGDSRLHGRARILQ